MSQEKEKNQSADSREVRTVVVDKGDINEQSWAKPTDPSPAPVDIAPLPPQPERGGESNPQQDGGGNPPPKQSEGGNTDSKGK